MYSFCCSALELIETLPDAPCGHQAPHLATKFSDKHLVSIALFERYPLVKIAY